MQVDMQKNAEYYSSDNIEICECDACRNYYNQIKDKYPEINSYLSSLNVDILKPLELIWYDYEGDNRIEYTNCQYVVFGSCKENFSLEINGVKFENNLYCHPSTDIDDEHFVLDFGTIVLEMRKQI